MLCYFKAIDHHSRATACRRMSWICWSFLWRCWFSYYLLRSEFSMRPRRAARGSGANWLGAGPYLQYVHCIGRALLYSLYSYIYYGFCFLVLWNEQWPIGYCTPIFECFCLAGDLSYHGTNRKYTPEGLRMIWNYARFCSKGKYLVLLISFPGFQRLECIWCFESIWKNSFAMFLRKFKRWFHSLQYLFQLLSSFRRLFLNDCPFLKRRDL